MGWHDVALAGKAEARSDYSQCPRRRNRPHRRRTGSVGQDLSGRNWNHADLSGLSLWGARCDGIQLLGARLFRTDFQKASLRGAELAFSYAAGASFRGADLRECSLYRAEIGLSRRHSSADFTDALVDEATDIPERKVFGERRLS